MKDYLKEAVQRAAINYKQRGEQEAFVNGVQWLISQPEIVKLFAIPVVRNSVCEVVDECIYGSHCNKNTEGCLDFKTN